MTEEQIERLALLAWQTYKGVHPGIVYDEALWTRQPEPLRTAYRAVARALAEAVAREMGGPWA